MTLTSIRDTGTTNNGGQNTTTYAYAATITVQPVNDAPTLNKNVELALNRARPSNT